MSATTDLFDGYKARKGFTSDNAAATALGVGRATASCWRTGIRHPSASLVQKMCEATGESVAKWLPMIEAERAATAADRKVWLRLAATAAAASVAILAPLLTRMSIYVKRHLRHNASHATAITRRTQPAAQLRRA